MDVIWPGPGSSARVSGPSETGAVECPGFVDHHAHLLRAAAGVPFPWQGSSVRAFHEHLAADGSTPMDVPEPPPPHQPAAMAARLHRGLATAAQAGLVEVTEMGMRDWWYLDALTTLQRRGPLPVRLRVYLASGLAEKASLAELDARRADAGAWVSLDGIKFYADGWLVPRTCALRDRFADQAGTGILFTDAATLARRAEPFAARGWRIATHAIGDRGVAVVLDAYAMIWGGDGAAIASAAPRIEHGSIQSADLVARCSELGVAVCVQPSFAVTDAAQVPVALGAEREPAAYPWTALAAAGVRMLAGTDYPIEVIEPLTGLARLVRGRSDRPGFGTDGTAPPHSRLPLDLAFALATDGAAGTTRLTADPRSCPAEHLDRIEVLGTIPAPF